MSIITIVGAGMMGSAMSFPASENGHKVRIVGTPLDRGIIRHALSTGCHMTLNMQLPDDVEFYQFDDVEKALKDANLIIGGVSSFGVDWFVNSVLPIISQDIPIIMVTKGLRDMPNGSLIPFPIYMNNTNVNKNLSISAIGGPCTSYELAKHHQTSVTFCGENLAYLKKFKSMLETKYYHISISTDIFGVESAVAFKNAYALAVSIAVGISQENSKHNVSQHYNTQAALFSQSLTEIAKLIKLFGGKQNKIFLAAGDLYVTVFGGRTRLLGTLLGKGYSAKDALEELGEITLESIAIVEATAKSIKILEKQKKAKQKDFPLLFHLYEILFHNQKVNIPWKLFEIIE